MTDQRGIIQGILILVIGIGMLLFGAVGAYALQHRVAGIGNFNQVAGIGLSCPNGLTAQVPLNGSTGLMDGPPINLASRVEHIKIHATAYYGPLPNQEKYVRGSFEAEQKLQGKGKHTSSGIPPTILGVAAPPSYPFGTRIEIPGYGLSTVVDRGCAIQEAGVRDTCGSKRNYGVTAHDHIDVFMGFGDAGREAAMSGWGTKILDAKIYWFDDMDDKKRRSYINICHPSIGTRAEVPLFKQCDPKWRSHSYGFGSTMCEGACGPTAAAMVLAYYGKAVDPPAIADQVLSAGNLRIKNQGTSDRMFGYIAKKYDLNFESGASWDKAKNYIQEGKPVIAHMSGALTHPSGSGMFSPGTGHYIVLTGISNNTVSINDPGPKNITQATESQIKNHLRGRRFHLIYP